MICSLIRWFIRALFLNNSLYEYASKGKEDKSGKDESVEWNEIWTCKQA
jgi:hypothetical protein